MTRVSRCSGSSARAGTCWAAGTGKATPYLGARVGYASASATIQGTDISQNGFAFGGGVGVMISMSPTLAIDLNGMFHSVSLGDADIGGTTEPNTSVSVTALQIRAGVNFKLGGQ